MKSAKIECLNCGEVVLGKYCSNCAQKSDTKRLDILHFIQHDIIHGTLHFDRGLPFTIKQIILRPGVVASEYIQGKRVKYYNFFYLTLLLIGIILSIKSFYKQKFGIEPPINSSEYDNGIKFAQSNLKVIFLFFIPLLVLCSKIIYRKQKLNISEHTVIAVINVIYFLFFALISNSLYLIAKFLNWNLSNQLSSYFIYLGILSFIRIYFLYFQDSFPSKMKALYSAMGIAILFITLLFSVVMGLIAVAQ